MLWVAFFLGASQNNISKKGFCLMGQSVHTIVFIYFHVCKVCHSINVSITRLLPEGQVFFFVCMCVCMRVKSMAGVTLQLTHSLFNYVSLFGNCSKYPYLYLHLNWTWPNLFIHMFVCLFCSFNHLKILACFDSSTLLELISGLNYRSHSFNYYICLFLPTVFMCCYFNI